ncbi:hypothetical protein [Bacillus mycoides]|uniref:hypothetical protein n=1 Tax=Bacillus mycoides TaxID=1405 RepID=UPI003D246F65
MYELTIGLAYDDSLTFEKKYRYDFVIMNYQYYDWNREIFVLRTIKEGKGKGNVLIDLIHESNISAISINLHGDCHFHIFKYEDFIKDKQIEITENISLEKIENTSNDEYYVNLKGQKYKLNNGEPFKDSDCIQPPVVKYLLLTQYHGLVVNMNSTELSPIFELQREHIWHNNRYSNYNDTSNLDVDNKIVGHELDLSTPWGKVKEIVKENKEVWREKKDEKYNQILELHRSQKYTPIR